MDERTRNLRFKVFEYFLDRCRPPTVDELASRCDCTALDAQSMLKRLQELHHLKLHDDKVALPTPIAMAHPFSHLPTPYVVVRYQNPVQVQDSKSWYANCAWCAFGLAAMLQPAKAHVSVLTHHGENLRFEVQDNEFHSVTREDGTLESAQNYFVIFSPPPSKWWQDVRFACSTIQVCTSLEEAQRWHAERGFYPGTLLDMCTLWELSKVRSMYFGSSKVMRVAGTDGISEWYHDKASYKYERKTPEEAAALFKRLGMTAEYWST